MFGEIGGGGNIKLACSIRGGGEVVWCCCCCCCCDWPIKKLGGSDGKADGNPPAAWGEKWVERGEIWDDDLKLRHKKIIKKIDFY